MRTLYALRRTAAAVAMGAMLAAGATGAFAAPAATAPPAARPASHVWKPVADRVYMQEVGERILTTRPVTDVAVVGGEAFAVVDGLVHAVRGTALQPAAGSPTGVRRLRVLAGDLWAAADGGAYRYAAGAWKRVDQRPIVDLCLHLGKVHAATADAILRLDGGAFVDIKPAGGYLSNDSTVVMDDFSQVLADPVLIGPISRIASYSGTLYILRPGSLGLLDGKTFVADPIDWGTLPGATRDILVQGSQLYVTTDRGVAVLRGMALTTLKGADGLPYEDTTCLAPGFDSDLWIGTTRGAIRRVGSEWHYFGAQNWLPADNVRAIAIGPRVAYIATDGGLSIIRYEPYTLAKKAAWFQREMDEWGFKRLGFTHSLYWSGEKDGWLREVSDNDGGHTAHYLAAMSYRYAATGDPKAREEAVEAFNGMAWLQDITGIPGFIARAVWSVKADKGSRSDRGSGGLPAKWWPTADGLFAWKGDTSSDEVNGHIYSVALFHDLVAKGREKERARNHIARLSAHIMDNGWVLRDKDGKPTRWGRWDPDYLLKPYGAESRGLNGMEAQTYVITAKALTGDEKFQRGLDQLIKWRYHTYTVRQRLTFPPDTVVPWDDELAFRCYLPLLSYAKDPALRSVYLRSLERSWEILRMQRFPWFNFIYGALTGNDCEAPEAAANLREYPIDLVSYSYRNSHRSDLAPRPGYVPYSWGTRAFSPRETSAEWDSAGSLHPDGGSGGHAVACPDSWLESYWMGRYYGMIQAPRTTDAAALTIKPRTVTRRVAAPYAGPPRPAAH